MAKIIKAISFLWKRLSYPVSMPEEVSYALGTVLPAGKVSFQKLMNSILDPQNPPTRLSRFMSRNKAESLFFSAVKKERFVNSSVYSYCFCTGWLEFILQFDDASRLRRVYVQHRDLQGDDGVEIPLIDRSRVG